MKHGLTKATIDKMCAVFARFPEVEKVVLYGSRAKGNFKTGSDIDLTLHGESLTADLRSAIASALDDLLLPYTIDLSVFEDLNHAKLREHIERVGVVFCQRASNGEHQGPAMTKRWQRKQLGELAELKGRIGWRGLTAKEYTKEGPLFISVHSLNYGDYVDFRDAFHISENRYVESPEIMLQKDDVLICKDGAGIGKVGIVGELPNRATINSSLLLIRSGKEILPKFLYRCLSSPYFQQIVNSRLNGATTPHLYQRDITEFPIVLPPLPEQQRIVRILDKAFEGIATAKANAEKNLQNARALFESHLQSVFAKRGEGWTTKTFSELCDIKHGFAFRSEHFTSEGDYVLLTPGNFYESGGYRDRGEKQKYYTGDIPRDFVLNEGDLLVAMTEQAAGLLGSPILVPESNKFLHNQRLGLVTKKPGVPWTNEFFFHVFNTEAVRKEIHGSASGVKVRHTSPTKIGEVVVSFPTSLSEQRAIVCNLEDLRAETQNLASLYERKLAALEALKKSLLHQAFSGEL